MGELRTLSDVREREEAQGAGYMDKRGTVGRVIGAGEKQQRESREAREESCQRHRKRDRRYIVWDPRQGGMVGGVKVSYRVNIR